MTIGKSQFPYRCYAKLFTTWDSRAKVLRLGRVVWARGRLMHGGYTAKLSWALTPKMFQFKRERSEWFLVLICIRLHYQRDYGGAMC